jgi:limonene-1,2-epoxide hydrolase
MKKTIIAAFSMTLVCLTGCATKPTADPVASYLLADGATRGVILGRSEEADAIRRFRAFYSSLTGESVRTETARLYAPDVFFNDTLKTLHGNRAVEEYFLRTVAHTEFVRTRVTDVARSGSNYYVHWVMDVRFRGSSRTIRTIGMTHLKFNREGRIVLHQDYWDSTAGVFEYVPILGPVIRWIKMLI